MTEGQRRVFMRISPCVPLSFALVMVLMQPAAACEPRDATQGHAHSAVDPMTTSCVTLDTVMVGDIAVSAAWARAMLPDQPAGGGFVTLENKGDEADRLASISSNVAGRTELHTMEVVDDVMVMRPVKAGLEIGPGETVAMKPGGMHLMFLDLDTPFVEGGAVTVTLVFDKAGPVKIELPVMKAPHTEQAASAHQMH